MSKETTNWQDPCGDHYDPDEYRMIVLWRIKDALLGYAKQMERGEAPMKDGPAALREAMLIMEHVE